MSRKSRERRKRISAKLRSYFPFFNNAKNQRALLRATIDIYERIDEMEQRIQLINEYQLPKIVEALSNLAQDGTRVKNENGVREGAVEDESAV